MRKLRDTLKRTRSAVNRLITRTKLKTSYSSAKRLSQTSATRFPLMKRQQFSLRSTLSRKLSRPTTQTTSRLSPTNSRKHSPRSQLRFTRLQAQLHRLPRALLRAAALTTTAAMTAATEAIS